MAQILNTSENGENRAGGERPMHRFLIRYWSGRQTLREYEGEGGAVTIPEGVTSIGTSCFIGCKSLTKITFPKTLKAIGGAAFFGCTELKSIVIPEGVTEIHDDAFCHCCNLTSIQLPESLRYIGARAFLKCTNLKELRIFRPEDLGKAAFMGCKGLADENGFVIVDNRVFDYFGSSKTIRIPEGVIGIEECAFYGSSAENVVFPTGLKYILSKSFAGCPGVKCVRIPETVERFAWDAFDSGVRVEVPNRFFSWYGHHIDWVGY